jgi:transcriptional regulator with XRE-family HTH domain
MDKLSLFSKNLRFLRKQGAYRQEEISALFSKQANTIGNWENGKSEPNLTELIKLGEYFRVSVQDFLNRDLESQSFRQNKEPVPVGFQSDSNRTEEILNPISSDGGQDAFWLILRELRSVHEKVDLLLSRMESASLQKSSDKSSH